MIKIKHHGQDISHPLFGTSLSNWIRLLIDNDGIDRGYLDRAIFITFSTMLTLPTRLLFKLMYNPRIAKTSIHYPPIFIIGHWRSGTTFLHELLSQDPLLGYVSLWHTLVPYNFLVLRESKRFLSRFLPMTRPMDAMKIDIDGPYEEEAGLAALGPWSFFHCFHFPHVAKRQFRRSVLLEGLDAEELTSWKKNYLWFLKAVTYSNKGLRLVLKNPANTARIKTLLELFPKARFIHIYRNPYKVYVSTRYMRMRVLGRFALQQTTVEEVERSVLNDYVHLMNSYFEQKEQIPRGHLTEIRYEDLVADPMGQIRQIYANLGLPGLEAAEPAMRRYLDRQAGYTTNPYTIDEAVIRRVDKYWGFAVERWGYKPPS
ncbi:MAG: sulfotransferase family protein [Petrotogales bacterium]